MSVGTGDLITRIYGSFRGADFRGEEINLSRSPDCLNVWKDYKETESIRTRPGMVLNQSFEDTVYGIFFYKDKMLVHSGTNLYAVENGEKTLLCEELKKRKSNAFIYEDVFYFMDGNLYLQYDGSTLKDVYGYVPTTSIARKPAGGGTIHEDVNMLTPWRINTFLADGEYKRAKGNYIIENGIRIPQKNGDYFEESDGTYTKVPKGEYDYVDGEYVAKEYGDYYLEGSTEYYLDARNLDDGKPVLPPTVTVDDKPMIATIDFEYDLAEGKITFYKPPVAPKTDGQDNVSVKFKKTVEGYRDNVVKCTLLQVFDNRVFVSGNPDYPNTVWHCSLHDPTYFSDLDYYREGVDSAAVTGLVAGNNAIWVFREPSDANTTVFYHTPTIDSDYGKIYPSQHSSITTGCVGAAINFNDDIVFFSKRGMEGISGDVTTEQVVAHRSSLVDRKLTAENPLVYAHMCLAEWEGYLLVFVGRRVYLADSRAVLTYENHMEYEWFYWEMEKAITCATVKDGILYLGAADGVYTMSTETDEDGAYLPRVDMESYWVTPKDKAKAAQKLKTTNKRGCVVEATGDISVYAKVEDTDFEHIGTYENITDYFTCRIKRKKFKDIQLKFHSNTRFSLETATLEFFIGGYIKR
jgi:hypothetical protein